MNTELSIPSVIEETKALLGHARQSLIKVAANLHLIKQSGEFEGTFGQWAEDTFGLHPSMTSRLTKAYEAWVIEKGVLPNKLEGLDHNKLYDYIPLLEGKSEEEALAEVKTWNRADIKAEKGEKAPCIPDFKEVCVNCWVAREQHP